MKVRVIVCAVCLAMMLSIGCSSKEGSAPNVSQTKTMAAFSALLPPDLAGKTMVPRGKVFVDSLNKQKMDSTVDVNNEGGFDINGWAFDNKTNTVPDKLFIELAPVKGGDKYYAAAKRNEREDLAKAFNNPAIKKAAYSLKADIKSIPPGEYNINIVQVADGNAIISATGNRINKTN